MEIWFQHVKMSPMVVSIVLDTFYSVVFIQNGQLLRTLSGLYEDQKQNCLSNIKKPLERTWNEPLVCYKFSLA